MLARIVGDKMRSLIMEGFTKEEIEGRITREYGRIPSLSIWYDCCYNTICKEQGINRKKGEELKIKRSRPNVKQGK